MNLKSYKLQDTVTEPKLTDIKSTGEKLDIYHQRTEWIIEGVKETDWKMVQYPPSKKDIRNGFTGKIKEECDILISRIGKILHKNYPKEDYLGRYVRVISDKRKFEIVIQGLDSEVFFNNMVKELKIFESINVHGVNIVSKIRIYKTKSGNEIFDERFYIDGNYYSPQ